MCQTCKKRAAMLHHDTTTAIEAHRAEIVELFTQVNNQANGDLVAKTRAAIQEGITDEEFALLFSPYIAGFILGSTGLMNPSRADQMIAIFAGALGDGAAYVGAREVH